MPHQWSIRLIGSGDEVANKTETPNLTLEGEFGSSHL